MITAAVRPPGSKAKHLPPAGSLTTLLMLFVETFGNAAHLSEALLHRQGVVRNAAPYIVPDLHQPNVVTSSIARVDQCGPDDLDMILSQKPADLGGFANLVEEALDGVGRHGALLGPIREASQR